MEVAVINLLITGLVIFTVVTGAPTWGWLAIVAAAVVGNVLGWMAS